MPDRATTLAPLIALADRALQGGLPINAVDRANLPDLERELVGAMSRYLSAMNAERLAPIPAQPAPSRAEVPDFRINLKEIGRRASNAAERDAIVAMLAYTNNKYEAAERLGICYKALLYKIREFGIKPSRSSYRRRAGKGVGQE